MDVWDSISVVLFTLPLFPLLTPITESCEQSVNLRGILFIQEGATTNTTVDKSELK